MSSYKLEEYEPEKDKSKYEVYRNDIKYRKHRTVDPLRAIWDDDVKKDFHEKNTDSIKYRLEECERERYETLDISHMNENCFRELFEDQTFNKIKNRIHHVFAKDCGIVELPDLSSLTSMITLDISHNKIKKIPGLPESIEELIVNDNNLSEVINEMPRLKRFNGSNNMISRFNYSESLESLYLTNNPVSQIPALSNLYYLNISSTKINKIESMPRLKTLDCSQTEIMKIPEMCLLEYLICNSSKVNDISSLKKLHGLEMVGAQILKVHHMDLMDTMTYHNDSRVKISTQYKIKYMRKNRNGIIELKFITQGTKHNEQNTMNMIQ